MRTPTPQELETHFSTRISDVKYYVEKGQMATARRRLAVLKYERELLTRWQVNQDLRREVADKRAMHVTAYNMRGSTPAAHSRAVVQAPVKKEAAASSASSPPPCALFLYAIAAFIAGVTTSVLLVYGAYAFLLAVDMHSAYNVARYAL